MDDNPIKDTEENAMFETPPESTPPGAESFSSQAQKDQFVGGASSEAPKAPGTQEVVDPRQQIEDLNEKLRNHYRGQWEQDAPQDPAERQRVLDQEFTEYSDKTGFPVEDKRKLESLQADFARSTGFRREVQASWTQSHQAQEQTRRSLRAAERASIEQKLAPQGKAA